MVSYGLASLLCLAPAAGAAWPQTFSDRRAVLRSAAAAAAIPAALGPLASHAISATTMTGKTKPSLGIYLLDEVQSSPSKKGNTLSADLVLSGGVVATTAFDTAWLPATGGYYDVEAQSRDGESAYVQVRSLEKGESFATLSKTWFAEALFSVDGRYGAYGAPIDTKLKEVKGEEVSGGRSFELAFTALSPGMAEVPRKGFLRAIQAPGSSDVLMLTCSSSASRWKSASAEATATAGSLRVVSTRPTELKPEPSADFRAGKTSGPSSMRSRNDGF